MSNKMVKLTEEQLQLKTDFIQNYINSINAATGSIFDPNSNVTVKNVGTLMAELNKDFDIQIERKLIYNELTKLFGKNFAIQYIDQLNNHEIYCHDETATVCPYCVAISLYPFLESGLKTFGGDSKFPKHLSAFNGGIINLIFALSTQFAGAIATVEYLMAFDYYAKLDYGEKYLETHTQIIAQELQQVVYALNQPASARGMQCPFWNISIFDKYYFDALFGHFSFPDGSQPQWESLNKLQKFFLTWFNKERTQAILTFPVVTVALLRDKDEIKDKEYEDFVSEEVSKGNSFFIYLSDTVDSLSSCCRLRNDISDQLNEFAYSLGAGGVMTGSINVITLNVNRFIQNCIKKLNIKKYNENDDLDKILEELKIQIQTMHKYQLGFRKFFDTLIEHNLMPAYTANFINIDKQYCTIGINGVLESAEFLGYIPNNNKDYINYVAKLLKTISDENKKANKKYNVKFNTEFVPAEGLGVKFAKWDKEDGYFVPRSCYNSYLYPVEDDELTLIDKFVLHGNDTMGYCDGGSALHLNLEDYPSPKQFKHILHVAAVTGCPYFCINVKITICNDCGYIDKHTLQKCSKCGSKNIDYGVRVIGYLRRISNFSKDRQLEAAKRYYHPVND